MYMTRQKSVGRFNVVISSFAKSSVEAAGSVFWVFKSSTLKFSKRLDPVCCQISKQYNYLKLKLVGLRFYGNNDKMSYAILKWVLGWLWVFSAYTHELHYSQSYSGFWNEVSKHVIPILQEWKRFTWWRHQMETLSALLATCVGNSPASAEFPAQRPVTRSFDVFFDLCLNKRPRKQSRGWWFETLSRPLWRHCNDQQTYCIKWSITVYGMAFCQIGEEPHPLHMHEIFNVLNITYSVKSLWPRDACMRQ